MSSSTCCGLRSVVVLGGESRSGSVGGRSPSCGDCPCCGESGTGDRVLFNDEGGDFGCLSMGFGGTGQLIGLVMVVGLGVAGLAD